MNVNNVDTINVHNVYTTPSQATKTLHIWYTNADSLRNKLTELKDRLKSSIHRPDIITITEVKAKNTRFPQTVAEFNIDGYDIFTHNVENTIGRGIIVYADTKLQAYEITLRTTFQEHLSVCTKLNNGEQLLLTCLYRSPSSTEENNQHLIELIKEIENTPMAFKMILGDFNYPTIEWNNLHCNSPNRDANYLKETILDCYMSQHVNFPTRARGDDTPSCIDWVFTNTDDIVNNITSHSPLGNSDHVLIECDINVHPRDEDSVRTKLYYDKGDYTGMREFVKTEMQNLPTSADADTMWDFFTKILHKAKDKYIPKKKVKKIGNRKTHQSAFDEKVIRKIKKKHRAWQRYLETRSGQKFIEYRRLSNQVKNLTTKAKKDLEKKIAKESKTNPKKFWNYVSRKSKVKQGIPDLVYEDEDSNEKTTTSDKEKAEVLSNFFSSVFTHEDLQDIPTPDKKSFKNWLKTITISKEKIKKKLLQLKISKSQGPDELHPRLLKELTDEISAPLEAIFIQSLKEGKTPEKWKTGEISAIFKKGSRRHAGNYRPVSLTSVVCKIMESLIREEVIKHMRDNKLFSPLQYGFIDRRSTTLQLLYVLDEWTEIIDSGGTIDAVYMDFMKAFDKVPHVRLLKKLESYGIGGVLLKWISSFLTGRKQRVRVGSATSEWSAVTSGIPQGSVLGPILFVIYINDLPDALKNDSKAVMYADDTKVYRRTDTPNGQQLLQEDLDALYKWSEKWQLRFHPDKCQSQAQKRSSGGNAWLDITNTH